MFFDQFDQLQHQFDVFLCFYAPTTFCSRERVWKDDAKEDLNHVTTLKNVSMTPLKSLSLIMWD